MQVLPIETRPASARLIRRHRPPAARYQTYRACLRWEFGFSCVFCLLHEADLSAFGVEGTALTSIEHYETQISSPHLEGVYENCFYVCRFCNTARGPKPHEKDGARLLNPCDVTWGEHFEMSACELRPRPADRDAAYTAQAYDLNDDRRKRIRLDRARVIAEALKAIETYPALLAVMLEAADRASSDADRIAILRGAQVVRTDLIAKRRDLGRHIAVPLDADASCRCEGPRTLPEHLARQTLEIAD